MYIQIFHGGKEVKKFEPLGGVDTIPLQCLPLTLWGPPCPNSCHCQSPGHELHDDVDLAAFLHTRRHLKEAAVGHGTRTLDRKGYGSHITLFI